MRNLHDGKRKAPSMSEILLWAVGASVLMIVSDWAGWHFVWRHENLNSSGNEIRKRTALSYVVSYLIPLMPTAIIIGGPEILQWYDEGFTTASSKVCFFLLALMSFGLTASGYSWKSRHDESQESRRLTGEGEILPESAMQHLVWTSTLMGITSLAWFYLVLF